MSILAPIIEWVIELIGEFGYFGIFILMVLESAGIPIPSEAVVTFSGFLATRGVFDFWLVVLVSTLANLVGSMIFYYIGYFWGEPFVKRYGKYLYLGTHHLELARKWFNKYGGITVFVGRITPAVRTYISFPAGVGRMNIYSFTVLTIIGSVIWNFILAYFGVWLGENWEIITGYIDTIAVIAVIALLIIVLIYFRRSKLQDIEK